MGYRDFRDPTGKNWMAWDVVPHMVERRQGPRRQSPASAALAEERDRRVGIDRRMVRSTRARLGDGMDGGWLCFENEREKRRLAPIPSDWMQCAERQLAEYCKQASHVRERPKRAQSQRAFPGEREAPQQSEPQ
ncbi:MAG: hypothetical protein H0X64_02465 [Gemmatimonadaceae bacterium]|nr:hypothetical protein [Gemmatimonadaceae bacterium]